jgi:CubicO group peptidase (beta-lactamase class C family)
MVAVRSWRTADAATGEPLRIDHHFRIASQTKVMTAVVVSS